MQESGSFQKRLVQLPTGFVGLKGSDLLQSANYELISNDMSYVHSKRRQSALIRTALARGFVFAGPPTESETGTERPGATQIMQISV